MNRCTTYLQTDKNIREPPDYNGNGPTQDIPIGGSREDIKNTK